MTGISDKLEIIIDGDSWVFGSEIADPELAKRYPPNSHPGVYDYLEENNTYRIPRIFSTHLEKLMDANVTNLSWPADDNGTILRRTIAYITSNYITKKKSVENLFVIIGWSSPERNSFWYKDEKISHPFRLWPQVANFNAKPQEEFWKLYVQYLWNAEEYIPRYVLNVLQFQNFCDSNNIKWICFNSFYQTPNKNVNEWNDLDISKELDNLTNIRFPYSKTEYKTHTLNESLNYHSIWDTIDPIRFYKKDQLNNTFKSYIECTVDTPLTGWHPSPEGHEAWAKELHRYIVENNLI